MIKYEITINNPRSHQLEVVMTIEKPDPDGQVLSLPNWIPGSYMIRDFAKNIITIEAFGNQQALDLQSLSKSSWQVASHQGELVVKYSVFAYDLSVRSAHIDDQHAFFNGTSVFLKPGFIDDQLFLVDILKVKPAFCQNWTVKTTLPAHKIDAAGYGQYQINGYQALIDHPVEISDSIDIAFQAGNRPHSIHFTGDVYHPLDEQRLAGDLTKICNEHIALFNDGLMPETYRFLTMVSENGYGGLEHKSSTALLCSPDDLPFLNTDSNKDKYIQFLGLCSHEYFHLWNVKRLKPENFVNLELDQEIYTDMLWFFEGITSYYDDLGLLRSGCIAIEDYLKLLAQTLTRLNQVMGRFKQTVTDSSFTAWTKFYKQDSNAINAIVSYYTKGAVIAFGLDMMIRTESSGRQSLDHLMRKLWKEHGKDEQGLNEMDVQQAVSEITGKDQSEFFEMCLHSTRELPIDDWLAVIGIAIRRRQAANALDMGNYVEYEKLADKSDTNSLTFGLKLKNNSLEVMSVFNDSPAEKAGVCPEDELIALNHRKLTADKFDAMLGQLSSGEQYSLYLFRRGRLVETFITPEVTPENVFDLYLVGSEDLTERQIAMRNHWSASSQLRNE